MALIIRSRRNWGEFDGDLLNLILSNVFGKDRLSFSLVCRHWNAVAAASPYGCSPCLMYYYWRTRTWKFYQYNTVFNASFPDLENAEIRCSKYGWLLMERYDNSTLFFFDPSNNRKVTLPCKVGALYISLCFFSPPTSSECVVVGIKTMERGEKVEICTLKLGEDEWDTMQFPINEPGQTFWGSLSPSVLHCGLIYFLSVEGDVAILDMKQRSLDFNFRCFESDYFDMKEQYLVKVNGEDDTLFGVFVFDDERKVNVFRLMCSEIMKWDVVEGIGDKVFYLSSTSSLGEKAHSKSMENTIYFPLFHGDDAAHVFYSLNDAKYHSLDGGYLESHAYGLKNLNRAAWMMPMLTLQEES